MNLLQLFILAVASATQTPKPTLYEFLRNIDPPRLGQHLEIRLKDNSEQPIQGVFCNRTEDKYALETDENLMRIIHILDIDSVTNI